MQRNMNAPQQQQQLSASLRGNKIAADAIVPPSSRVAPSNSQKALQSGNMVPPLSLCRCDIIFGKAIGSGGFGVVVKAKSSRTDQPFAIKFLKKQTIVSRNQTDNVNSEARLLMKMQSPFVCKAFGAFQDTGNLYIVMEFVPGGDLATLIEINKRFSEITARFYAIEIILALSYIHSEGIIHRDIKPSNILIANDGHIKLSDFGLARKNDISCPSGGTLEYLAPELFSRIPDYTPSVDWYSFGISMFVLLTGLHPYPRDTEARLKGPSAIQWPRSVMGGIAMDLIWNLLLTDPTFRLGSEFRGGAPDVMAHPWFRGIDWKRAMRRDTYPPFVPSLKDAHDTRMFAFESKDIQIHADSVSEDKYHAMFPLFQRSKCCYDVTPKTSRS